MAQVEAGRSKRRYQADDPIQDFTNALGRDAGVEARVLDGDPNDQRSVRPRDDYALVVGDVGPNAPGGRQEIKVLASDRTHRDAYPYRLPQHPAPGASRDDDVAGLDVSLVQSNPGRLRGRCA